MGVKRIVPDFTTGHMESSRKFYEDFLGMEVVMDMDWVLTLAGDGSPRSQITLVARDETAPVDPDVSIEVDDVDELHDDALRRGYEVIHPLTDEAWGVRRFFVKDPDGHVVNVLSHSD